VADDVHIQPEELPVTSAQPLELPEKQIALFAEVLDALEQKHVPFAVSGAVALQEHTGICRWTKDLDIFLTAQNAPIALRHLAKQGFECEVRDPVWLSKARRDDFFVDLITGMSNGVITVDDSWIERAKRTTLHGVSTRILAAEELIASKLFVIRRERFDGADIVHVIYGTRGQLDWQRILSLAGEHWEILFWALVLFRYVYPAQTHYVPRVIWDDLLRRFAEVVANPDPKARFRGSLVDDRMFAIDVNDWGLENMLEEYRAKRLARIANIAAKPS
jgi:hypothetical protein